MNQSKRDKILLAVLSIFLSLLFLEIIVRVLPKDITSIDFNLVGEDRIFTSSRDMKFRPNLTRTWTGLGRPTIWHFNELGYRERGTQIEKPENIYRIAFLGDSIVMGFGVEEYESLPRRLENFLRPQNLVDGMTHFEVLNFGIQGYSTPHYLAVLKEDVLRMKPDVVIVGFYTNDVAESVSFEANKKYVFLKSLPDIIPYRISQFLKRNSRLYLFALGRYYSYVERTSVKVNYDDSTIDMGWSFVRRDFREMSELAHKNGVKLILLGIPNSSLEVATGKVSTRRLRELSGIAKDYDITYYDMFNDLRKYKNAGSLYLDKFDDHFSIEGNEYVAGLIGEFLRSTTIIPGK